MSKDTSSSTVVGMGIESLDGFIALSPERRISVEGVNKMAPSKPRTTEQSQNEKTKSSTEKK